MKISFALANKLASFKNAKQPFETGAEYTLVYPTGDATEDTLITIDESREIKVADLLNLIVSANTEKVGEYTFMKKGERAVSLGQQLTADAKKAGNEDGFELPSSIKIISRVNVGTSLEKVKEGANAATVIKGYELHGINTSLDRIPQLWRTDRKEAKYDKKDDFKLRTRVLVSSK